MTKDYTERILNVFGEIYILMEFYGFERRKAI